MIVEARVNSGELEVESVAVLKIRREGDPILRQKAKPVERITRRVLKLLKDMEETMYAADGVGLAAPQVGISQRIFVVDVGDGPMHFINPVLLAAEGTDVDKEGCLSIPGTFGYVERAARVRLSALDAKGKSVRIDAEGFLARVLQHELDHLDGILFTDKATGIFKVTDSPAAPGEKTEAGAPS